MSLRIRDLLMVSLCLFLMAGAYAQPEHPEEPEHPPMDHFLPEVPEQLEEMIGMAMEMNPDVALAEAQLRAAAAELRQVRLEVVRELTGLQHERMALGMAIDRLHRLADEGRVPEEEMVELHTAMGELNAQARYLIGHGFPIESPLDGPHMPERPFVPAERPAFNEAQSALLDTRLPGGGNEVVSLEELIDGINEAAGVALVPDLDIDLDDEVVLPASEEGMTLRHFFGMLADQREYLCFVFRDYGILVTHRDRAEHLDAPTIPEDVPLYAPAPMHEEPPEEERRERMERRERERR